MFPNMENQSFLRSYDEIPPRVEYSLTDKGRSVVPILKSICQWSGTFYKEDNENEMTQCQNVTIGGRHNDKIYRRENIYTGSGTGAF